MQMKCVGIFVKTNPPLLYRMYCLLSVNLFLNCKVSENVWFWWKRSFYAYSARKWEFSKYLMAILCDEIFLRALKINVIVTCSYLVHGFLFSYEYSLLLIMGCLHVRGYTWLEAQNVSFYPHGNVHFGLVSRKIDWDFFSLPVSQSRSLCSVYQFV